VRTLLPCFRRAQGAKIAASTGGFSHGKCC
jgi:hypothetical protein